MIVGDKNETLFVEKYRPGTIDECILPKHIKDSFNDIIKRGDMQNLLLAGGAGCGKTTVAIAMCKELGSDYILINCSENGNIDTLRTQIRQFASTISLSGQKKVVILDEFDFSNPNSTQPALRGFIEEFSKNCRFVLTCNYKNRIIQPIHSRCTVIDFKIDKKEKRSLAGLFLSRIKEILDNENIEYDESVVAQLIIKYFPDFRRILNELQMYSAGGTIDVGILSQMAEVRIHDMVRYMKNKEFGNIRKWVVENADNDPTTVFRAIYDGLYDHFADHSIPNAVLILADYQYKSSFVADSEINLVACLAHIMMECEIK